MTDKVVYILLLYKDTNLLHHSELVQPALYSTSHYEGTIEVHDFPVLGNHLQRYLLAMESTK
jgi:hypothetical protein